MEKNWKNIKISYGNPELIPTLLADMYSFNDNVVEVAYWKIQHAVVLQSDLYEAAYYVIDPLLNMLKSDEYHNKFWPLDLLYEIFDGCANENNLIVDENGNSMQLTKACRLKIVSSVEVIEDAKVKSKEELKAKFDLLELLRNPKSMFPTIQESIEILKSIGYPPSSAGL